MKMDEIIPSWLIGWLCEYSDKNAYWKLQLQAPQLIGMIRVNLPRSRVAESDYVPCSVGFRTIVPP